VRLDGEEWCATCKGWRRYPSHGWGLGHDPDRVCPAPLTLPPPAGVVQGTARHTPPYGWCHRVTIAGRPLDIGPSRRVCDQSDGFNWGYSGSGPSQLALALLMTCLDAETAWRLAGHLKAEVVATWPKDEDFTYPLAALHGWVTARLAQLDA
jgi:hypothetical protein